MKVIHLQEMLFNLNRDFILEKNPVFIVKKV